MSDLSPSPAPTTGRPPARRLRSTLAGKLCIAVFLALLGVAGSVLWLGRAARTDLVANSREVQDSRRVAELAARSLNLLLTQDSVTQSILLNPDNLSDADRKIEAYDANADALKQMRELSGSDQVRRLIDEMNRLDERDLRPADTAILEALGDGKVEEARKLYFEQYVPKRNGYEALVRQLRQMADEDATRAAVGMIDRNQASWDRVSLAVLIGLGVVGGVVAVVTWRAGRRLRRTVEMVRAVARGDLTGQLRIGSRDEVGQIAETLNEAVVGIRNAVAADRVDWPEVGASGRRCSGSPSSSRTPRSTSCTRTPA
jgi:HAMP domain-containing protein